MDNTQLENAVKDLQKQIDLLQNKPIYQTQIMNGAVKSRHISEGVKYIQAGLTADLPAAEIPPQGVLIYYETDTKKIRIYNRDTADWDEVALT